MTRRIPPELRHAARIAAQGFRVTVHPDGAVTVEPVDVKPKEGVSLPDSGEDTVNLRRNSALTCGAGKLATQRFLIDAKGSGN